MERQIGESDWKVFRELRVTALERFCQSVLAEVSQLAIDTGQTSHQRYLAVFKLIRDLFLEFLVAGESLSVTTDALDLLSVYERRGVLGPRSRNDMLHIAVATVAEVDVLVSWNFKHIVRLDKIQLFNGINQEFGYRPVGIYSPREVATYGRED